MLTLVLALGAYGFAGSPWFTVRRLVVSGADGPEGQRIAAALESVRGSQLLRLDGRKVAEHLRQSPRVAEAWVVRRWPSTLEVVVRLRRAVAHFPYGLGLYEVDGEGRVLGPADQPGSRPVITGALAPGEAVAVGRIGPATLAAAARAAALAGPLLGERLQEVRVDGEGGRVQLNLADGSVIVWGELTATDGQASRDGRRVEVLRAVLGRLTGGGPWRLDLSEPERAVFRAGASPGAAQDAGRRR